MSEDDEPDMLESVLVLDVPEVPEAPMLDELLGVLEELELGVLEELDELELGIVDDELLLGVVVLEPAPIVLDDLSVFDVLDEVLGVVDEPVLMPEPVAVVPVALSPPDFWAVLLLLLSGPLLPAAPPADEPEVCAAA